MKDILFKTPTLRKAVATAIVRLSDADAMNAVLNKAVPKGDPFEFSRAAGLLAIKKTSDVIPDCHPIPIEFAAITYKTEKLSIHITVEVHTIYKTGVEVEAMHGAAVVALTMYDMPKPLDKGIEIARYDWRKNRVVRATTKKSSLTRFAVRSLFVRIAFQKGMQKISPEK